MKKYLFILCLLLVSTQAKADLATVLAWKYGNCMGTKQADPNDMSANPKMVISYWNCGEQQPNSEQIGIDTEEYYASQDYPAANFDPDLFESALWIKFAMGEFQFSMRNEASNLKELTRRKNFLGLKQYIGLLVSNGVANQGDVDGVKDCLLQQGINLDLWS